MSPVSVCVCSFVTFYTNLYSSFIYKEIFTKFAGNVYGYENMSENFCLILNKNQNGRHNHCLKLIKMLT